MEISHFPFAGSCHLLLRQKTSGEHVSVGKYKTIKKAYLRKASCCKFYDRVVNKDFVTLACTSFKKQIRKIQSVNVKEARYN